MIALNPGILFGEMETLFRHAGVVLIQFNTEIAAVEFLCHDGTGARAEEGVEDDITLAAAGENQLGKQFFGFLGGMVGVFGHGPEGDTEIRPEVGGMGQAKIAIGAALPVLWGTVVGVGSNDTPFQFHRIHIKKVVF